MVEGPPGVCGVDGSARVIAVGKMAAMRDIKMAFKQDAANNCNSQRTSCFQIRVVSLRLQCWCVSMVCTTGKPLTSVKTHLNHCTTGYHDFELSFICVLQSCQIFSLVTLVMANGRIRAHCNVGQGIFINVLCWITIDGYMCNACKAIEVRMVSVILKRS